MMTRNKQTMFITPDDQNKHHNLLPNTPRKSGDRVSLSYIANKILNTANIHG